MADPFLVGRAELVDVVGGQPTVPVSVISMAMPTLSAGL